MTGKKKNSYLIPGFQFSGISGGIKKDGARDLGLIHSDTIAAVSGVFTTNIVKAAPVLLDMERIREGRAQTILVNSGNANACTGKKGIENARLLTDLVADELEIDRDLVLVSSTGVIGQPLPMDRIVKKIPKAVQELSPHGINSLAEAIMTTDTRPKIEAETVSIDSKDVRICGVAKGAGMIHPRMATMLAFVVSDVSIESETLDAMTREGADRTFNRVTIDGDTSTNDTLLVLANGRGGNRLIKNSSPPGLLFREKLWAVMERLSKKLIEDAEGGTKCVEILVRRAPTERDALQVAFSIAHSPLVKTAFFGEDINWGRILCAAGYSGVVLDPGKMDLFLNDVQIVKNGVGCGKEAERQATMAMKKRSFTVTLELGLGAGEASVVTSDLSTDYVRINGSYRS
ncbi:MAG: bifunctional glutamate N-acetyltransferase/amino-acid acetyltransferase ArgJ [Proteobacteria bacterium]|nr:bifunctional glutamate N-acetyltransferase/amino-acid acetyltransferase ArgJ [Pseudomonadota bacterium]